MKMKKILSVVLAGAMVIGMNSFAMAAPSITAVLDTNNVTSSAGEVTITKEVDTTTLPEEGQKGVEALLAAETGVSLAEALETVELDLSAIPVTSELFEETPEAFEAREIKILTPVADLKIEGVEPTKEDPVWVNFTVNNITDDIDIYVLHYCEEHQWELLETEEVEGTENQIKAPFHSLSPVALVYADKVADTKTKTATAPATK